LQTGAVGKGGDGSTVENIAKPEAMPPHEREAQIRSMVDGLADRLESSPRDVEGWARLMRSRVVLGEKEAAATAFQKALEVFKDDSAASGTIIGAAIELGLKAE
jgi:cytochrome c-type biogenesis protein CcmH